MTGELQETVDKTVPCAAITEKRPNRLSGCVGVFFQLFDWNRRFAKKKLFSRKSLLPGKQASKRFSGNEKLLKSKTDDENRGTIMEFKKHEMRSPSLVARLMGLESIPSNHRDKGNKKKKTNKKKETLSSEEEDNGLDSKCRPEKMQRTTTGVSDRRVMVKKKFGSDSMQIKNVLTRVKKHHQNHLAVPVKSPRLLQRRNSRLINAAARILEPGKRNVKSAVAYPSSSRTIRCGNVSPDNSNNSVASSCKACGSSFVDAHGSSPVPESSTTPFERSKRSVFWRNQETSVNRDRGFIDQMERKAIHRARFEFNGKHVKDETAAFPPVPETTRLQSRRSCSSSSPANAFNYKEKDFISINSRKETGLNTCARKRRLGCGSSSSVSQVARGLDGESSCACSQCCMETKERTRVPYLMGERNMRAGSQKRIQLDAGTVGLIQQKLQEFTCQEEEEAAIRGNALPSKPASLILHELLSSLAHEQPYSRRKGKTEMIGNANSDYTSPGSVLDASFSNESCFSNSFDNISGGQMRLPLEPVEPNWDVLEDSTNVGNYQTIASLVSHVSNVLRSLSNTGLILTNQRFTNAREVIIQTELTTTTTTTRDNNYLIGPELFDELMIYAARSDTLLNLPGITGGFLVDSMIEHLEERNASSWFHPSSAEPEAEASELIRDVLEKVPKWAALARVEMDEVISVEMEKWMEIETHLFGVGSEIACEIVMCLVGELVMELFV